jgi:enoyl-CoA hydratase/carnithine racemase
VDLFIEHDGAVATLTINRPEVMNAMTREVYDDITNSLHELDNDQNIRAIIITGSGDRAFSAGADLRLFHTVGTAPEWRPWTPSRWDLGALCSKPLIAAINGYAVAGGLELALICDIRIASTQARFGATEVRWGLLGPVNTYCLPRVMGTSDAMLMLLTGRMIDATEALRIGMVSMVVESGALLDTARSIAAEICEHSPETVRMVKEMTLRGLDSSYEAHLRFSEALEAIAERSEAQRAGLTEFREHGAKRDHGQ